MLKVYGLKNCDTCRKARQWLAAQKIAHEFLDVRADGFSKADVQHWLAACGAEVVLNKRGTSWRALPQADKENLTAAKAAALAMQNPTLVKRPVFVAGKNFVAIGFGTDVQAALKRL